MFASGSPSIRERAALSMDFDRCMDRQGCWDYARQGCLFASGPTPRQLEATPKQAETRECHPKGDGDRLSEETKHLRLW